MEDPQQYRKAYLLEAEEILEQLNAGVLALEKNPKEKEAIAKLFRGFHTLKGNSAAMHYENIATLAHKLEDLLSNIREEKIQANKPIINTLLRGIDTLETLIKQVKEKGNPTENIEPTLQLLEAIEKGEDITTLTNIQAEKPETIQTVTTIKVDVKKLDNLLELVGELLVNKLSFEHLKKTYPALNHPVLQLERIIKDIQFHVMDARMIPVGHVFNRFPRMMRDLGDKLQKTITFTMEGNDIELDRSVLEQLGEPLVHLLRNAADHGISSDTEMKQQGKQGTITLTTQREKNTVIITIKDNGKGMDMEHVRKTAIAKGIITPTTPLTEEETLQLIFNNGFSTSDKVTDVSGRGVGLDVVKNKIESLQGTIQIKTKQGEGTSFILEFPATLAIVQCFLLQVMNNVYGIPMSSIVRTLRIEQKDIKSLEEEEMLIFEKKEIPLIRLHNLFDLPKESEKQEANTVIVIEKKGERAGLLIDKIVGKQEIIIKPLDSSLQHLKGFSGATILGDGSAALIIDVNTLV